MIRISYALHPTVATITMERAEKRNALNAELVEALTRAVDELGGRPDLRVIVLTGEGSTFSAGADLESLRAMQSATTEENRADSRRLAALFDAIVRCPLPVVARVNGHAIAGGCGLAALCDLAFAVESARFGFTEVRIGFVPALVSAHLRSRMRGSELRELLLTGRLIDAPEAERAGLITRAVSAETLDAVILDAARSIARGASREAVARTKAMLLEQGDLRRSEALERAVEINVEARGTPACRAGIAAFLERKDPPWTSAWDHDDRG